MSDHCKKNMQYLHQFSHYFKKIICQPIIILSIKKAKEAGDISKYLILPDWHSKMMIKKRKKVLSKSWYLQIYFYFFTFSFQISDIVLFVIRGGFDLVCSWCDKLSHYSLTVDTTHSLFSFSAD